MTTIRNVAFIGDGGVGKTTYLNRLATGDFEQRYLSTIGYKQHHLSGEKEAGEEAMLPTNSSFEIFDLAGQEKFNTLGLFLRERSDIDVYFIFFDLSHKLSFKNCDIWIRDVRKANPDADILLVATKADVMGRCVSKSTINKYMIKRGIPKCIEISTKSCYNWSKPFDHIDE